MSFKGYRPLRPDLGVSQRFPFHGAYIVPDMYDYDVSAEDKALTEIQGYGATEGTYINPDIYSYDVSSEDRLLRSVRGHALGLDADGVWKLAKSPLLRGLLVGTMAYGIARAVGATPAVQKRVGVVSGGLEVILGAASGWLAEQITGAMPAPAAPAAATSEIVGPPKSV